MSNKMTGTEIVVNLVLALLLGAYIIYVTTYGYNHVFANLLHLAPQSWQHVMALDTFFGLAAINTRLTLNEISGVVVKDKKKPIQRIFNSFGTWTMVHAIFWLMV